MTSFSYGKWFGAYLPEFILVAGALIILVMDLGFMRNQPRFSRMLLASVFFTAASAAALFALFNGSDITVLPSGMLVRDTLAVWVQAGILCLGIFCALSSLANSFTDHIGEFFSLLLMATTGMVLMSGTENLLMIFLSLELSSLCLYILAAFDKTRPETARASLQYFFTGGIAAAFTLFGISLIYGFSGKLGLQEIAQVFQKNSFPSALLLLGVILAMSGFVFKIASVPFHLWAPDVYSSSTASAAALIASASKLAAIFLFGKALIKGFAGLEGSGTFRNLESGWFPVLALFALASIVIGNLVAISQSSLRRLLAFSAIGHAGYMMLGILANNHNGLVSIYYYGVTYGAATLGAFSVIGFLDSRDNHGLDSLSGLWKRDPCLAIVLAVFLLSLAGIPPLAGFFGKFYLFVTILSSPAKLGWLWLVIVAIIFSGISLYYYLLMLKRAFVESPSVTAVEFPFSWTHLPLVGLAVGIVVLGAFPGLLLDPVIVAK